MTGPTAVSTRNLVDVVSCSSGLPDFVYHIAHESVQLLPCKKSVFYSHMKLTPLCSTMALAKVVRFVLLEQLASHFFRGWRLFDNENRNVSGAWIRLLHTNGGYSEMFYFSTPNPRTVTPN